MGVDLSGIIVAQKKKLDDFKGKVIAVDAFNTLYQFLSIIRQPDGTPLKDSRGRITSHLSGLIYRTANLMELGIKPIYVFDGKPHPLKAKTVEERSMVRAKAKVEWAEALEKGDIERARTKAMASSKLSEDMVNSAKQLLEKMGLPYVQAASEGEAQASSMVARGEVWGTASQDYDSLLFGCPALIRNLTITGRRKVPRKDIYIDIEPELIDLEFNLKEWSITREQLVDIAILVGTDFNDGLRGIGSKKALGLIRQLKDLETIINKKNLELENYEEIRDIFLNPKIIEDYEIVWKEPDESALMEFLVDGYEFSESRIKSAIEKIRASKSMREQQTLEQWM